MRVRIGDHVGVLRTPPTQQQGQPPVYMTAPAVVCYVHGLGGVPCTVDLEIVGESGLRRDVPYAALSVAAPINTWHFLPPWERVPA